jgi:hypothetical protein
MSNSQMVLAALTFVILVMYLMKRRSRLSQDEN